MDAAEVAVGGLVVSGCKAPGVSQLIEAALGHIGQRVDCGIDGQLDQAVPLGRDHRHAASVFHALTNEISVVRLVPEQHFGRRPVGTHDGQIAFKVRDLTAAQGERYDKPCEQPTWKRPLKLDVDRELPDI